MSDGQSDASDAAYRKSAIKLVSYSLLLAVSLGALLVAASHHMYIYLLPAAFSVFMATALVAIRGYGFLKLHRRG